MKYLIRRTLRIIGNTLTQFLAIILIIAIGSIIFTGLIGTIRILDTWTHEYYASNKLADSWVYVEAYSKSDVEKLERKYKNSEIEGRHTIKVDGVINGQSVYYVFLSQTSINQVQLMSGSLDVSGNKVIIDESFAKANNISIGSIFSIKLNETFDYEVIGLFQSPEFSYKSKDNSDGASNKAGVAVVYTSSENIISMLKQSDDYIEAQTEVEEKLAEAQAEIDDAYRTLLKERKKYNQEKIDVYAEIDQNKQDLISKRDELYHKLNELNNNKRQVESGLSQLNVGINQAETQFQQAIDEIKQVITNLENTPGLPDQSTWETNLQIARYQLSQTEIARDAELQKLNAQRDELYAAQAQIHEGEAQINDGLIQIEEGFVKIEAAYVQANKEFKKADKLLKDAFKEYEDGLAEFNEEKANAYLKLDESVVDYYELLVSGENTSLLENEIKQDDRFIYWVDRVNYPGNAMLENILRPIKVMTFIFPPLFFVVAAVLILITMAKMVEHDRTQIAIMKALGLSTRKITLSYLMYGWCAAISGSLIFGYVGNWLIPTVLLNIFNTRFSIPNIEIIYYHDLSFYAILLSIFFASVAILLALRSVLKETPSQGLRPKAPKNARRSFLEKNQWIWTKFSYSSKLMIRNLSVGRIKILLSSIGVVGAIALLIIGITLQNSANLTIENTINSYDFDASIQIVEEVGFDQVPELPIAIDKIEPYKQFNADYGDQIIQVSALTNHQELLLIKNVDHDLIDIKSDSVIIPQSFAILNDLEIGDKLNLKYDDNDYSFIISDINNQYLGKTIFISIDRLDDLGIELNTNRFYIKSSHEFNDAIKDVLIRNEMIESVDSKRNVINQSNEMLSMLNQVILIILIASFALTSTVIYNLASINIVEREREIATLRVLGYTHREVKRLINSENYVLLSLGALFGVPLGIFLSQWISHMVTTNEFYMPDVVEVNGLIFAVSIAFVITFITNLILEIKIRRIQLVESLKAVE